LTPALELKIDKTAFANVLMIFQCYVTGYRLF